MIFQAAQDNNRRPRVSAAGHVTVTKLDDCNRQEVLVFLAKRPLHTVIMSSFVRDNGLVSPLNRGTFYACRDEEGRLVGVALIGQGRQGVALTDNELTGAKRRVKPFARVLGARGFVEQKFGQGIDFVIRVKHYLSYGFRE